jgi:hypothetical protein
MRKSCLLLLAFCFVVITRNAALGSKCPQPPSVPKAYSEAAAVFFGEVVGVEDFYIKFKVERAWKGVVSDEITLVLGAVGLENGIIYNRDLLWRYNFVLGKKYLVYASKIPKGLYAHRCSRTKPEEYAKKELEELERIGKSEGMIRRKAKSNKGMQRTRN